MHSKKFKLDNRTYEYKNDCVKFKKVLLNRLKNIYLASDIISDFKLLSKNEQTYLFNCLLSQYNNSISKCLNECFPQKLYNNIEGTYYITDEQNQSSFTKFKLKDLFPTKKLKLIFFDNAHLLIGNQLVEYQDIAEKIYSQPNDGPKLLYFTSLQNNDIIEYRNLLLTFNINSSTTVSNVKNIEFMNLDFVFVDDEQNSILNAFNSKGHLKFRLKFLNSNSDVSVDYFKASGSTFSFAKRRMIDLFTKQRFTNLNTSNIIRTFYHTCKTVPIETSFEDYHIKYLVDDVDEDTVRSMMKHFKNKLVFSCSNNNGNVFELNVYEVFLNKLRNGKYSYEFKQTVDPLGNESSVKSRFLSHLDLNDEEAREIFLNIFNIYNESPNTFVPPIYCPRNYIRLCVYKSLDSLDCNVVNKHYPISKYIFHTVEEGDYYHCYLVDCDVFSVVNHNLLKSEYEITSFFYHDNYGSIFRIVFEKNCIFINELGKSGTCQNSILKFDKQTLHKVYIQYVGNKYTIFAIECVQNIQHTSKRSHDLDNVYLQVVVDTVNHKTFMNTLDDVPPQYSENVFGLPKDLSVKLTSDRLIFTHVDAVKARFFEHLFNKQ